jgi:hypothetical protein
MLVLVSIVAACSACPGGGNFPRPAGYDTVEQVTAKLAAGRDQAKSFRANTLSDYWLRNQRLKGDVKMMGMPGSKVHFAALSPAGGSTLLEMVCDGTNFVLLDQQNNCALSGPCNADSIAQLLHLPLAPDDFFYLALGQTPVIAGATGKVTWDSKRGYLVVVLTGSGGGQTIEIDARNNLFDVVKSEMRGSDGKMIWVVEHKGYQEITGGDEPATTMRVPGSSRFQAKGEKSDVIVDWNEPELNVELPPQAFELIDVSGFNTCAQGPANP